jgi:hypothetical protein
MEQEGIVTKDTLMPDSLIERMRREVIDNMSVVVGRYEVGAWSRLP